MPKGIFFLIHDEIKGPEIKCSYFTSQLNLTKEFVSKLYMSHAGLESSRIIEIKFDHYKSISSFTGSLDRRSQKEGILGVILEENEVYSNLDLFLMRNLEYVSNNQNDQVMEDIYTHKLLNFLELLKILEKVEVDEIPEIYIMSGEHEYNSCILKIGDSKVSNTELAEIFKKAIEKEDIPQYYYLKLNVEQFKNIFLVFKINKENQEINKIISIIAPYIERFFYYSLELMFLFLFPSIVGIVPYTPKLAKKYKDKNESILKNLQISNNYKQEFENLISALIEGDIYISPLQKF
jgi:hypothetical protein